MNTNKKALNMRLAFAAAAVGLSVAAVSGVGIAAPASPSAPEAKSFPLKMLQQAVDSSQVRVIKTVAQLPPDVRARFRENVPRMGDTKSTATYPVDMANPGKSWNAGCMQVPGLPNRQLQFAGVAKETCFVVFNSGGIASMQWVVLFDLGGGKVQLVGKARATSRVTDLAGLRKMVKSEAFQVASKSTTISL